MLFRYPTNACTHLKSVNAFNFLLQCVRNQPVLLDYCEALESLTGDDDGIERPTAA